MSKSLDSIRVAIRVRPLIKRENNCKHNWSVDGNTIYQVNNDGKIVPNTAYAFDRIFDKEHSTIDLYLDFAKPIVLSVMEGINGTLFAYGQTSSGKTYTMSGDEHSPGIIPFALKEVFDFISKTQNREFLLRVSYMEIYNEVIRDLLEPKNTNLKVRENINKEILVEKLTEKVVTNVDQIFDMIQLGEKNRHFGSTNMNERSSRSHTIFRMVAESRETHSRASVDGGELAGAVKVSQLNLVDLAGSERASQTGAEGVRLREGGFINKSLFVLANVINKLSDGESTFVPFRDSKLTRILQNSLGGNTKTAIICAVTPASIDETVSTLQFASRAKTVKNRPEVNEVLADDGTMLKRYRREISDLKLKLEKSHSREEVLKHEMELKVAQDMSHSREEVLKREMELKMEKDKIQAELEEQRRAAEETKAQLRELTNRFCTAGQPKENLEKQRKQRRWTVCPMGANRGPLLQLDLPAVFDAEFGRKRLDLTYAGTPNSDFGIVDFTEENHQRFLEDLQDAEEKKSLENACELNTADENIDILSVNVSEGRTLELELEIKRVIEERDALREERDSILEDLSENITSSSEMQKDLLEAKNTLKKKKQENRELEERLQQLEATLQATLQATSLNNENNERRVKIEELAVANNQEELNAEIQALKTRVGELEDLNSVLRYEVDEQSSASTEIASQVSSKPFEDALNEKDFEIAELQEKIELLSNKLSRKRRRASHHTLDQSVSSVDPETNEEEYEDNGPFDTTVNQDLCMLQKLRRTSAVVQDLEGKEAVVAKIDEYTKSDKITELEKLLADALSSKQALAERHDEYVKTSTDKLEEKEAESGRKSEELRQLLAQELARNAQLEEKLATMLDEALREQNPIGDCVQPEQLPDASPARKRKHPEAPAVVQLNATPEEVVPKRLKDDKLAQINGQFETIVDLEKQLELALASKETSMKDYDEMMAKQQQKFEGELSEKNTELQDLMNQVKQLNEMLQRDTNNEVTKDASETGLSTDTEDITGPEESVDELKRKFEEELLQKDLELRQKSLEIENFCKLNTEQFDQGELVKKLQEELYQRGEQVQEKTCEVEHLKLLIGNGGNESQEDLPPSDVNLEEKSHEEEQMSEADFEGIVADLQEKYEAIIAQMSKDLQYKSKEVDRLSRKEMIATLVENPEAEALEAELCAVKMDLDNALGEVAMLKDKLEAAKILVKENESPGNTEMETQFREEISLLKEKLEAAISEKDSLVKENEARISEMETRFHVDVSLVKEEVEELEAAVSEKEDLGQNNEARVAEVETQFREEIRVLRETLEGVVSEKENLAKENEARVSDVEARLREELEKKEAEISEEKDKLSDLKTQIDAVISEKDQLREKNTAEFEEKLRELCIAQAELEKKKFEVDELREKFEKVISEKDDITKELLRLQETLGAESAKKDSEIQEIMSTHTKRDAEIQEAISSKETLIQEHQATVVRLEDEFSKELDQMRRAAEESSKEIAELRENLRKTEKASSENEAFVLKLNEKDEMIATKSSLVSKLEKEIEVLIESEQKVIEERQAIAASLKTDFDDQIEEIRQAVMEKERELVRSQEENVNAVRAELDREREQLKARANESAAKIHELDNMILEKEIQYEESVMENEKLKEQVEKSIVENKTLKEQVEESVVENKTLKEQVDNLVGEAKQISHDLKQKTDRISELESEIGKASENETESLQNDLKSTIEELNRIKVDLRAKCDEVSTLQKKVQETSQAMETLKNDNADTVQELLQQNNILKMDLEKLLGEHQDLKTDSETHQVKKEMDVSQSPEDSCKDCRRRSGLRQGRRESDVFKSMLHDIKEQVGKEQGVKQDQLIDELNHTLVTTQERLQQKEFELDEKEIEIIEKDELVQTLQEKLETAEQLSVSRESKDVELKAQLKQETENVTDLRTKLKSAEEELFEAKREFEMAIEKLRHETNSLQEKVHDYESVLGEEQLKELYRTMEEKTQKITDLEQKLIEVPGKDSKIGELEMEIDILEGEITSLKGRSDGDQESIRELQQMLREQEKHIVQLEACKADLKLERDETIGGELRDLRVELESARSRLAVLEEEKSHGIRVMQEKTELLGEYEANVKLLEQNIQNLEQNIQNKDKELKEAFGKLERALKDANEKDVSTKQTVQELAKSEAELKKMKTSFETVSDGLKRIKGELNEQRESHDTEIQKLNSDIQVAEGAFKKAMKDKFETDEIVKEKEAECEGYKQKIRDLELHQTVQSDELAALKSRQISVSTELEKYKVQIQHLDEQYKNRIAELTKEHTDKTTSAGCQGNNAWDSEKEEELAKVKNELEKTLTKLKKKQTEFKKSDDALQECEDELAEEKVKVYDLEVENEDLKKQLKERDEGTNIKQLAEDSREAELLRSKVSSLDAEVARLRELSDRNLEEELKKAQGELKTKEMDLFHVQFESTKQLDRARNKIRELESDVSNYARKSNDLRAEIRSLRNRDDEPTVDFITRDMPSSSSNGENVGVVGSVALFSLNARVEKLGDENKALQEKSETLQKEVNKLGIINLDVKQKYGQLTGKYGQLAEKYNRLKLKFADVVEAQQKMAVASKAEQSTGVELQASARPVQNNDSSLGGDRSRSQSAFQDHRPEPESKEQDNQSGSSVQAQPAFRYNTTNFVFKPSNESAFKKPLSIPSSSTAGKPAGPIPSREVSKPVRSSVGLPRRASEEKQPGIMQASRLQTTEITGMMRANDKTTNGSSSFEKAKKAVFSKQNKENNFFSTDDKPDACKPQ